MLKQRIVTAALALIVVMAVLLAGSMPWRVFVWLGCLVAASEFSNLLGIRWNRLPSWWAYAVVTVTQWDSAWNSVIFFELSVGVTLLLPVVLRNRVTLSQSSAVFIGALYIGFGGAGLADLRALSHGWAWLLLFLVSIWMTDTAAFFVGSRLKGPKLWPDISPGKTISGAVGGLFGGVIGALLFGLLFLPGHGVLQFMILGFVTSTAGQLGDLIESAYKRTAGVKDSGHLLPGHGGILDRIDSLLFAAPFAYYLIMIGFPKGWL